MTISPTLLRPALFMHVPKTSGSALVSSFVATGRGHTTEGFDRAIFGTFDRWETIAPETRAKIAMSPDDLPRDAIMIAGHYALSTLRAAFPASPVVTILRDPSTRLLSHWLYWRATDPATTTVWGAWADLVLRAHRPLGAFLADPELACQLDNIVTRMLLWPHRLIPAGGFIEERHDLRLLREARAKLRSLDFVDLVEDPALDRNLAALFDWPWTRKTINVTERIPADRRFPLHEAFTAEATRRLRSNTRLDQVLWTDIARRRLGRGDEARVAQDRARLVAAARYGALMA